jgi:hypothetical protein
MKTLTRTIIVLITLDLTMAGFAIAQTPPAPAESAPAQALPTLPSVNNNIYSLTKSLSYGSRFDSTGTVLVIPSEQTRTEDLIKINEDMNVMSRIFEKNLEQDRITTVHSSIFVSRRDTFATLLGGSRGEIQSMYLQGYGALFLMKVDFPLSPPTDIQEEEQEPQKAEEGDQVWAQVKQEMYEPEKADRRRRTDRPEEKYDAEKVENLKTTLIKALKHAANIRVLKLDESLILSITGSGVSDRIVSIQEISGTNQTVVVKESGGQKTTKVYVGLPEDIESSSPTMLVIRAKKSDIDAFAKGGLDLNQFRQHVQILSYPLLSGNVAGTTTSLTLPSRLGTGIR